MSTMNTILIFKPNAYFDDGRYCEKAKDLEGNDYYIYYDILDSYKKVQEVWENAGSDEEAKAELDRLDLPYSMEECDACDWYNPVEVYSLEECKTYTDIKSVDYGTVLVEDRQKEVVLIDEVYSPFNNEIEIIRKDYDSKDLTDNEDYIRKSRIASAKIKKIRSENTAKTIIGRERNTLISNEANGKENRNAHYISAFYLDKDGLIIDKHMYRSPVNVSTIEKYGKIEYADFDVIENTILEWVFCVKKALKENNGDTDCFVRNYLETEYKRGEALEHLKAIRKDEDCDPFDSFVLGEDGSINIKEMDNPEYRHWDEIYSEQDDKIREAAHYLIMYEIAKSPRDEWVERFYGDFQKTIDTAVEKYMETLSPEARKPRKKYHY